MKIAAICSTYKRPQQLEAAIKCFCLQDYPCHLRELIVLDDANQYACQEQDNWKLISIPKRFRSLGEKRNASAALVSADTEAYCVWDDDDIYLPWHMSAAVAALENGDFAIPTALFTEHEQSLKQSDNQLLFHGGWSYRRTAFEQVSGYPFSHNGEDQGLLSRFQSANFNRVDPIQYDSRPSYVYRWYTSHSNHISAMGDDGYEKLGNLPAERVDKIQPQWDRDWVKLAEHALNTTNP